MLPEKYKPNQKEVEKYLEKWDSLENYVLQENALDKLFFTTYPKNVDIDDILIKVSALNDFYSTNIFSVFPVAKHILSLNIDEAIKNSDESIVNKMALVNMNGKTKNFYSFATKYCSHHFPNEYPIYDIYVEKVLMALNKRDHFYKFKKIELKNFSTFKSVIIAFRLFYGLDKFSVKDIDRYIWQLGKEYFPNKY
ncbi:hypothetical protein [Streptococcus sp. CSL10205-OR2]|uniref:hypothetical protein n=1 Tax=Streptococcus sp. CSL10205-OR2 TaxID=2980558 RepID=UPI0021DAC246|nr:hypothetical protein [Streptococcus sp. CSL10205-OR2]MCU9533553.1 hypothetical protein [Streptococcus sp. CSL10205-OR2]